MGEIRGIARLYPLILLIPLTGDHVTPFFALRADRLAHPPAPNDR
jgi:hypothetical protein